MKRFLVWSLLSISIGTALAARAQTAAPLSSAGASSAVPLSSARAPTAALSSSARAPTAALSPSARAPTAALSPSARAPTAALSPSARASAAPPAHVQPPAARPANAPAAPSFSPMRFLVESVVGILLGSAAYYGGLRIVCHQGSCDGGEIAGFGAALIATPVSVSAAGWTMGGQGTFSSAIMGEIIGFVLGTSMAPLNRKISLNIALTLGPATSAGLFESREDSEPTGFMLGFMRVNPYAAPTMSPTGLTGGTLGLRGQF